MRGKWKRIVLLTLIGFAIMSSGIVTTPTAAVADVTYHIRAQIWDAEAEVWMPMSWAEVRFYLNEQQLTDDCDLAGWAEVTVANWDLNGWEAEISQGFPGIGHYVEDGDPEGDAVEPPIEFAGSVNTGYLWVVPDNGF